MVRIFKLIKCFIFGLCPMCNSDAPKIDDCWVCISYRSGFSGMPSDVTRARWWRRYTIQKNLNEYTKAIKK